MHPFTAPSGAQAAILGSILATSVALSTGAAVVEATSGPIGIPVPDDTPTGLVHGIAISGPGVVESVQVRLRLDVPEGESAWLGDLYVHLQHASGLAVLMNRPGRTAESAFGYSDRGGLDVVFSDTVAFGDIHTLHAALAVPEPDSLLGTLTGVWQTDGRAVDPSSVLDTSPRTARLDAFSGHPLGGTWNLFIADLSGGGRYRLQEWSLTFETEAIAVPEPPNAAVVITGTLAASALLRRLRRRKT